VRRRLTGLQRSARDVLTISRPAAIRRNACNYRVAIQPNTRGHAIE